MQQLRYDPYALTPVIVRIPISLRPKITYVLAPQDPFTYSISSAFNKFGESVFDVSLSTGVNVNEGLHVQEFETSATSGHTLFSLSDTF